MLLDYPKQLLVTAVLLMVFGVVMPFLMVMNGMNTCLLDKSRYGMGSSLVSKYIDRQSHYLFE